MNDGLLGKSSPECNVEGRVGLCSTFQGHCIVHAEYRETREVESNLCPCDIELVSSPDPTAGRHAWAGHETNIEL